jgi:hypothetical protein
MHDISNSYVDRFAFVSWLNVLRCKMGEMTRRRAAAGARKSRIGRQAGESGSGPGGRGRYALSRLQIPGGQGIL